MFTVVCCSCDASGLKPVDSASASASDSHSHSPRLLTQPQASQLQPCTLLATLPLATPLLCWIRFLRPQGKSLRSSFAAPQPNFGWLHCHGCQQRSGPTQQPHLDLLHDPCCVRHDASEWCSYLHSLRQPCLTDMQGQQSRWGLGQCGR